MARQHDFGPILKPRDQLRLAALGPVTRRDLGMRQPVEDAAMDAANLGRDVPIDDRHDIRARRLADRQRAEQLLYLKSSGLGNAEVFRSYMPGRASRSEGNSPKIALYSPANRPNCQNP
jgi:hypothetical protein